MRIALRPSGGRGEYEMSGSQGEVGVADVMDRHIKIQLFPGNVIDTGNWVRRKDGKPRIRLEDQRTDQHLYLSLADLLLLPKPIRELKKTPSGELQWVAGMYSVDSIQFVMLSLSQGQLVIQPTKLILRNSGDNFAEVNVLERMKVLQDVWAYIDVAEGSISSALEAHRDAVMSGNISGMKKSANSIRRLCPDGDPLRWIIGRLSLTDVYKHWADTRLNSDEIEIIEDDDIDFDEAAMRGIREWRLQASRGSEGAKFSRDVKEAYSNRCLFTGYHLPKSRYVASAGVDSAHILPWAQYNINAVNNGVCLSKLCHWAFDAGILLLHYKNASESYELVVSENAKRAEREGLLSLDGFYPLEGAIPKDRLPQERENWPSPKYLGMYNSAIQA